MAYVVQALEGAHACGAHGNNGSGSGGKLGEEVTRHADELGVHVVSANVVALHGLESAGTHMQSELTAGNATTVALGKHLVGKVQTCRGCCHAAVDVAVHGLVVGEVAFLGATVQVRRNGNLAQRLEHRGKCHFVAIPAEDYLKCVATALATGGTDGDGLAIDGDRLRERTALPALAVAHQAQPCALAGGLENELVIVGSDRFEAEDLDLAACGFAKAQTGVDHARVVIDEHGIAGQQLWHFLENVLFNGVVFVHEHLALLALR